MIIPEYLGPDTPENQNQEIRINPINHSSKLWITAQDSLSEVVAAVASGDGDEAFLALKKSIRAFAEYQVHGVPPGLTNDEAREYAALKSSMFRNIDGFVMYIGSDPDDLERLRELERRANLPEGNGR